MTPSAARRRPVTASDVSVVTGASCGTGRCRPPVSAGFRAGVTPTSGALPEEAVTTRHSGSPRRDMGSAGSLG